MASSRGSPVGGVGGRPEAWGGRPKEFGRGRGVYGRPTPACNPRATLWRAPSMADHPSGRSHPARSPHFGPFSPKPVEPPCGACGQRPKRGLLSTGNGAALPLFIPRAFATFAVSPIATASIRRSSPRGSPPTAGRPIPSREGFRTPSRRFSTLVDGLVDNPEPGSTALVSSSEPSLAADLWDTGSSALRAQLAEATWNTWFREVRPVRCDDDILVLAVPNAVACERIRSSYSGLLTDLLHDATGRDVSIELVVDQAPRRDDRSRSPSRRPPRHRRHRPRARFRRTPPRPGSARAMPAKRPPRPGPR